MPIAENQVILHLMHARLMPTSWDTCRPGGHFHFILSLCLRSNVQQMLSGHWRNKFTEIIMSRKFTEDPQNSGLFRDFQNLRSWTQIIRARSSLRVVRSSQSCPALRLGIWPSCLQSQLWKQEAWSTSCCSCLEVMHPQGNHSDQRRSSQQVSLSGANLSSLWPQWWWEEVEGGCLLHAGHQVCAHLPPSLPSTQHAPFRAGCPQKPVMERL